MSEKGVQNKEAQTIYNQYIVGIGASAGGLEAIMDLFDSIPQDMQCSYIIVQHLSPDYKSMMPELLEKHTKMKIYEAHDGVLVKPNSIYVIPHRKNMTFKYGKLKLTDKDVAKGPNTAIDIFFNSLAEEKKEKVIGIILSGTGTDGTKGLEAIKRAGGLTIVQEPLTAKFDGMPNSAINSGFADYVLAPELMQEEIMHYVNDGYVSTRTTPSNDVDEPHITEILSYLKLKQGYDFTAYKRPTISRRIAKRMVFLGISSVAEYKELLIKNPEEGKFLCKDFLIGVTRFFRDEQAFDKLAIEAIPEIFRDKEAGQEVKIWVAGCSTGEEAYSMAILVQEHLQKIKKEFDIKIFATDIDKEAIDFAAKGCYPKKIEKEISSQRLASFFEPIGENYKVLPILRKIVVFAQHDLVRNAPYSKTDLVSCRNMLIYLSPSLQKNILSKFHFSLNENGYLFLGPSENIGGFELVFLEVDKKWKLFRNTSTDKRISLESFSTLGQVNSFLTDGKSTVKTERLHSSANFSVQSLNDILLKECNYSAVYINESFELLQASGNYHHYLQFPKKNLDLNILKMLPDELCVAVGTSLRKASKLDERVSLNNVKVKKKQNTKSVEVIVIPASDKKSMKKCFWVLFRDVKGSKIQRKEVLFSEEDFNTHERVAEIEQELKETKENLQTAIEELETANEEMQSSNEELVSANEELQSTNEELQSLNEELHTVNAEHQLKIKELIDLNDDLNNYFRSTDIGQVFIDRNLMIRKYTPSIVEQINLIGSDVGRPITNISNNINYNYLASDIHHVIATKEIVQKEIWTKNNKSFIMKILPYVKQDQTVDGVVITFVDITNLKDLNKQLSGVLDSSLNGIIAFKTIRDNKNRIIDFECTMANSACENIFKIPGKELLGKHLTTDFPQTRERNAFEKYCKVVDTGQMLHEEAYYETLKSWLEVVAIKMDDGLAITFADITDQKSSEERIKIAYEELKKAQENLSKLNNELESRVSERTKELSISEERFKTLSLATNDAIWDWDFVSNKVWWNEGFKNLFGYSENQIEPGVESWFNRIHPEDKNRVVKGIQEVITKGKKQWSGEYRLLKADGSYASILDRAYVLNHEDGMPYRMIGSMVDLSNMKKVQTELENTNQNLTKINADLDNFIYTASHDLKAPISNIEGLMYALRETIEEENDDIKALLEMVNLSIEKFKETIKGLTDIAKIQKEHVEDLEMINLKELVEEVRFSIKDMFVSSHATIKYDIQENLIRFSKKNLRSIIYNLLSNAIKYKSLDKDPIIEISSRKAGEYTLLCVKDNGLGIDKSKQPQIFTMFKRFHTHVEGTGIGLYIVKRMVENGGGKIEVDSDTNNGTTFRVYLKN